MAKKKRLPEINGLSIDSMTISQDGELKIIFDLPTDQTTLAYQRELQGIRSMDVYEYPELQELCRDLFRAVRRVASRPDPDMADVHCDRCRSSDCCRKYNVLVHDEDLERLSAGLGLTRETLRRKYLADAIDWCEDYRWQLACDEDAQGEKCVFLQANGDGQMRCSIYEHRPDICRAFDMKTCTDFVPMEDLKSS